MTKVSPADGPRTLAAPSPVEILRHPPWRLLTGEVVTLYREIENRMYTGRILIDDGSGPRHALAWELVGAVRASLVTEPWREKETP